MAATGRDLVGMGPGAGADLAAAGPELVRAAGVAARELFNRQRANCAEAVFLAVYERLGSGLPPEVAALITGLGGGVAISGVLCGAWLAGVVAMGLVYGRARPEEGELSAQRGDLWKTYALYNQLPHRFRERCGSLVCRELTAPHVYGTKACRQVCEGYVQTAAELTMELLREAARQGLGFEFKSCLLDQYARAAGVAVRELIALKTKGEPFPPLGR